MPGAHSVPELQRIVRDINRGLVSFLGGRFKRSWRRRKLSDEELMYYLSCPKIIRAKLRWEHVPTRPSRTPRARLKAWVYCSDGEGQSIRLRASVNRSGYSVSLLYPARPMEIRLAGLDSRETTAYGGKTVPGAHVQLWSREDETDPGRGHHRVSHCSRASLAQGTAVNEALHEFLRITNIDMKHPFQTVIHIGS